MAWGFIACWFSFWEFSCTFLCYKLRKIKRINRRRRRVLEHQFDTSEEYDDDDDDNNESFSYGISRPIEVSSHSLSGRLRDYKGVHLKKSLRPRNHRIKVGISRDALYKRKPTKHVHDIRVTHTSKFAHKGSNYRGRVHRSRRSL